jgi:hypothetical protein
MAYYEDLSEYKYDLSFSHTGTRNIGWLAKGHGFPIAEPSDETLGILWLFCSVQFALTRGAHGCDFCHTEDFVYAERAGERLLLGTSEIRVFPVSGPAIYAAPTTIYHYMFVHHYKPPDEFLEALHNGPRPPSDVYMERLKGLPVGKRRL